MRRHLHPTPYQRGRKVRPSFRPERDEEGNDSHSPSPCAHAAGSLVARKATPRSLVQHVAASSLVERIGGTQSHRQLARGMQSRCPLIDGSQSRRPLIGGTQSPPAHWCNAKPLPSHWWNTKPPPERLRLLGGGVLGRSRARNPCCGGG